MVRLPKWFLVALAVALLVGLAAPVLADETKGKIKSVSADKKEFVFTDKDGKDWTFKMADDAKVQLGTKEAKLNDLKAGDEVTVTYKKEGNDLIASEVKAQRK